MIIYDGISSEEIGVIVEHYPVYTLPQRRYKVIEVPGRNGNIIVDQGSYTNYEQKYEVFLDAKDKGGLPTVMKKLSSWLASGRGYCKLEDSYYPNSYRLAFIENAIEFRNHFNIYGRGTLVFNCAPQRYLKSGDQEIAVATKIVDSETDTMLTETIYNPTNYPSDPIIRYYGGYGVTKIKAIRDGETESVDITVSSSSGGDVFTIDVANHIFWQNDTKLPSGFTGDFESLRLGKETQYEFSINVGHIRYVFMRITPRWWTL